MGTNVVRVFLIDPKALHVSQHIAMPAKQWAKVKQEQAKPKCAECGRAEVFTDGICLSCFGK